MTIRVSSKALIVHEGRILLNRCRHEDGRVYYDLPGGGQHPGESMEQALIREVTEETGLHVRPGRFAAIAEEIYTSQELQERYPDYCHRIIHLFIASVIGQMGEICAEKDFCMEESEWIALEQVNTLPELVPYGLQEKLDQILKDGGFVQLPTTYYGWTKA